MINRGGKSFKDFTQLNRTDAQNKFRSYISPLPLRWVLLPPRSRVQRTSGTPKKKQVQYFVEDLAQICPPIPLWISYWDSEVMSCNTDD